MKPFFKWVVSSFIASILLLLAYPVNSAPYLYTFSGSVDYIEIDGAYYSDVDFDNDYTTVEDTFSVGETMQYVFLVDFDVAGFCEGPLGTTYSDTCTAVELPDSNTANYFFTDLVSATKLAPSTEEGTNFNYGLSTSNLGMLLGDSAVFVYSVYGEPVDNWVAKTELSPGTIVMGADAWAAAYGNSPYGRINSTLELISIEPYVVSTKKVKKNKKCMKKRSNKGKKPKWRTACN